MKSDKLQLSFLVLFFILSGWPLLFFSHFPAPLFYFPPFSSSIVLSSSSLIPLISSPLISLLSSPTVLLASPSFGQAIGNDCEGVLGDYGYSLRALSEATGGIDLNCTDAVGHIYWYRPCQVVLQPGCALHDTPGICQRDQKYVMNLRI